MTPQRWARLLALILVGTVHMPASAQVVRGRFLERSSAEPVEAGVITLLDSAGAEVAQVLSHADGWYAVSAPAPGRYRLRAQRIGYEDVVTGVFTLAARQVLEQELTASVRAIPLKGLTVRGTSRCALRPEQGVQTLALWNAVRTALQATRLTRAERRLHYDVAEYTLDLSPTALDPLKPPQSKIRSGLADHPFVSAPVEDLMREGFVRRGAEETAYFAPDAEVLLSEPFLARHCLQVVAPEESSGGSAVRIGLAFRPVREHSVPDVEGTLWVDRGTYELRTLEYHYTGLRVPDADKLGGRVEFARVASVGWIVSRWYVRMPVLSARIPTRRMTDPTPSRRQPHLQRIVEQGGVVIRAREVREGVVFVSADPMAAGLGAEPAGHSADETKATQVSTVAACPDSLGDRGGGRLLGTVRRRDTGEPVPAETVTVEWTRWVALGSDLERFRSTGAGVVTRSDAHGRYLVCGLPLEVPLRVHAGAAGGGGLPVNVTLRGSLLLQRDLSVVRRTGEAARPEQGDAEDAARERGVAAAELEGGEAASAGVVKGRVVDAITGRPVPNVHVTLTEGPDSIGPTTDRMSRPDGSFSFSGISAGKHRLRAECIGYGPGAWDVDVGAGGLAIKLELQSEPLPLEGLVVRGHSAAALSGFEARRARKLGTFIDRAEIERLTPRRSSDLVRLVPGLRVICPGFSIGCTLRVETPPAVFNVVKGQVAKNGDCPIQYFLDGLLQPPYGFQLDDLLPDEIEAIEVYTHAAAVPARFNIGRNSRCGVVVVWTRGR